MEEEEGVGQRWRGKRKKRKREGDRGGWGRERRGGGRSWLLFLCFLVVDVRVNALLAYIGHPFVTMK